MQEIGGALAIVVGGKQVGLAVRRGTGFCFVATQPGFEVLDGSRFWRIEAVQDAARRLWRATLPVTAPRSAQLKRHLTVVPFRPAPRQHFDWCAASGWEAWSQSEERGSLAMAPGRPHLIIA
jgi:hypothetical protein